MENLFGGIPVRSVYIRETKHHWFSAVDICAALLGCDYQKARNYWKWYKHTTEMKHRQEVRITNQLKMQAADGRLRLTDVLDADSVIRLIMLFPGHRADKFKLWMAKIVSGGKNAVKHVIKALNTAKDTVRHRVGNLFYTTEKRDFDIHGDFDISNANGGGVGFIPCSEVLII